MRYSRRAPGTLQKFCFLSLPRRNFKLIRLMWYVKLHGNHCKISDNKLLGHIVWVRNGCKSNQQSELWGTQNSHLVLPNFLANTFFFPYPFFSHSFTHYSTFKLDFIRPPFRMRYQYVLVLCLLGGLKPSPATRMMPL